MRLNLMPLRERKGDIIPLCEYFIRRISKRIGKDNIMRLTDESKALLLSMDWLGNIRELQNLIECIVQLYPGDLILPQYILENTMSCQRPTALEMQAASPLRGSGNGCQSRRCPGWEPSPERNWRTRWRCVVKTAPRPPNIWEYPEERFTGSWKNTHCRMKIRRP